MVDTVQTGEIVTQPGMVETIPAAAPVSYTGVWQTIQMKVSSFFSQMSLSANTFLQLGMYLVGGFIFGFLLKKYFSTVIFLLVLGLLLVLGFEYLQVITIDWTAFRSLLGLQEQMTIGQLLTAWGTMIKDNLVPVISGLVGFIVGYRLG